ncbi:MAG TPA: hypothetical protein VJH20_00975 [Candidatus Nanoarchaeia archaeon]|nr:hypothetical protein [Candidatus Nanoarchaeia archaeon]
MNDYQDKVFDAAVRQELEGTTDFYYVIWESHGYLVLLPKISVEERIINLGTIVVTANRIVGYNPILVSELEKMVNKI